jgi:hypothetical protein
LVTVTSGEGGVVIGLKGGEGRMEHFSARHEDDIQARRRFLLSEQLAGETLGAVPHNRGSEFPSGGNSKPAPVAAVRRHEQGHEPAGQTQAVLIRLLEFRSPSNPILPGKALRHHPGARLLPLVRDGQALSTLCTTAFQHDPAILCRHPHTEAVGLAPAACVGLKRALTLCHCDLCPGRIERRNVVP